MGLAEIDRRASDEDLACAIEKVPVGAELVVHRVGRLGLTRVSPPIGSLVVDRGDFGCHCCNARANVMRRMPVQKGERGKGRSPFRYDGKSDPGS